MRALCLLLIIANLGFLGWAQFVDTGAPQETRVPTPPPAAQKLVLASEAPSSARTAALEPPNPAAKEAQPPEQGAEAASAPTAPRCQSVGPFRDLPAAVQASAALQSAGFAPRQRLEQGELWVGYWVNLSGLPTRDAAEQAMARLKEHGITDAYIMPSTDSTNVLSLGVFSDHARAQRRADEVRGYGFEPQVTDRKRPGAAYWVDVDLPDAKKALDPGILQTEPGKIVRLEVQNCPARAE